MRRRAVFILVALAANGVCMRVACGANPEGWDEATRLYTSGDYVHALARFNDMSARFGNNPSLHYMIGMCYKGQGKTEQAKKELEWCSRYASDARVRQMAQQSLQQLTGAVAQPASPVTSFIKTGSTMQPPGKVFVDDSASATVAAAQRLGWRPCSGGCLTFATRGWHHMHVDGHPDTDQWITFEYTAPGAEGKSSYSFMQGHVGHLIKVFGYQPAVDAGECPVCHGSGWEKIK